MDRKHLKLAGKNLFQKNYWYSVLVVFLMMFTGMSTGSVNFNFSFDLPSSKPSPDSALDAVLGSPEGNQSFLEDFFLSMEEGLEGFLSHPVANIFFVVFFLVIGISLVLKYLVFSSMYCGGIRYFLKSRKNQPAEIKEVFENLRDKTNFNIAKVTFSKNLSVFLWTLVFIIPGVIKSYEYFAVEYILAVRPDIDKNEAKRLSKILMDGNKCDLFVLGLSFIGWNILSIFTMGLLNIFYVNPYIHATHVEFFSDIRLKAIADGKITPNDIPDYEYVDPQVQQQGYYQQPRNVVYGPNGMPVNNGAAQQPKNVVYRPDMQQGNVNYAQQTATPPTYQQTWNNPYAPQQTVQEPTQQTTEAVAEEAPEEPTIEE